MLVFEHSIHVAVWDFLSENPTAFKYQWPGWDNHRELDQQLLIETQYCMACYYQGQVMELKTGDDAKYTPFCLWCPLLWPGGKCTQCSQGTKHGLFNMYRNAESLIEKVEYAKMIRDLPVRPTIVIR